MKRSEVVRREITAAVKQLKDVRFRLGELIDETYRNGYFLDWGYKTSGEWLSSAELGIGKRQAYYFLNIYRVSRKLQIKEKSISGVKTSIFNKILELDPAVFGDEIRSLVDEAANGASLKEVTKTVHTLLGRKAQVVFSVGFNSARSKDKVKRAIKKARVHDECETDAEALEYICDFFISR